MFLCKLYVISSETDKSKAFEPVFIQDEINNPERALKDDPIPSTISLQDYLTKWRMRHIILERNYS